MDENFNFSQPTDKTRNSKFKLDTQSQNIQEGTRARNMEDLYDKVLTGRGASEHFKEMNLFISTGYCDSKEIGFIRLLNSLIRSFEFLEEINDDIDLEPLKKDMRQRMAFVTHSSKSYDGFAVKSIQTQRNITSQSLIQQEQEEEKGLMDKLKGLMDKAPKNKRFLPQQRDNIW